MLYKIFICLKTLCCLSKDKAAAVLLELLTKALWVDLRVHGMACSLDVLVI
jgi:hypothetical protein